VVHGSHCVLLNGWGTKFLSM